jgi:hypothetical protein
MVRIQRERPFVIQDRFPEISQPEPGVTQVVAQVRVPAAGVDETLIAIGRLLKTAFAVRLVRPG